ncbi:unnamed protein product [Rhizopus stolonifer]
MSLSLKSFVQNSKLLSSFLKPVSSAYANAAGYRKMGLKYDNLVAEENEIVKEALRRLEIAEPRAAYDCAYRIRMAQQFSLVINSYPRKNGSRLLKTLDIFNLILNKSLLNVLNVKLSITSRFLLATR